MDRLELIKIAKEHVIGSLQNPQGADFEDDNIEITGDENKGYKIRGVVYARNQINEIAKDVYVVVMKKMGKKYRVAEFYFENDKKIDRKILMLEICVGLGIVLLLGVVFLLAYLGI